jgi:[Skp1-protein]-hydroxyproline N-acetylglucosaminyltransferase
MTTIRRQNASRSGGGDGNPLRMIALFLALFILVLYLSLPNSPETVAMEKMIKGSDYHNMTGVVRQGIRSAVALRREQLSHALKHLTDGGVPQRLRTLRDKHQIVGERLGEVKAGKETVEEILHGADMSHHSSNKPPMSLDEIVSYLDGWIHTLHGVLGGYKHATFDQIWQAYHDLAVKTLFPWDQEYLSRMPPRREDGSVFLSLATYRDENCFNTIYNAYAKAKNPDKLFVGLTQQNCHKDCKSGVLANLSMVEVPPDEDCYAKFCETDIGKPICENKQVRVLNIDEPESLGPYAARYFTSKMWYGEEWFMQTDAHMTFATDWDAISIEMLKSAPSDKPVLSHYPPSHTVDLDKRKHMAASRLCGPVFATSDLESQIIRLEGAGNFDKKQLPQPGFAPFTAAGYFVAHSRVLSEVPFDPFLPWIFMGEEIIMSSRLWTAGYDIFSPTMSVVGHMYVRRHKPKFWESVHRAFTFGGKMNQASFMRLQMAAHWTLHLIPQFITLCKVLSWTVSSINSVTPRQRKTF